MKILVTGGGTIEPIDNVRAITNFSTGRTSASMADLFSDLGHDVTLLQSVRGARCLNSSVDVVGYLTFSDLQKELESLCGSNDFDLVVHAAAVSDFSVDTVEVDGKVFGAGEFAKIPSGSELIIKMKKNPKLVDSIKMWSRKKCALVAFKLTSNATMDERKAAVKKVFDSTGSKDAAPDFVVSNDLSEITDKAHPFRIWRFGMDEVALVDGTQKLVEQICALV